jgi:hypothetical protein
MEKFTTHITFKSGDTNVEPPIQASGIMPTIQRLCEGPAAAMGIIDRAIIVDQSDQICVEIKGRTVVYPMDLHLQQRAYRLKQKKAARIAALGGK